MRATKSRLKVWCGRLAMVLFSTILSLIGAEFIARKYLVAENISNDVWDGFNNKLDEGMYLPDPELGYVPGPSKWCKGQGLLGCQNGREFDLNNKARELLLLGDSLLQFRVMERATKHVLYGKGFRVWNVGIGGYNTLQEAIYLEKYVKVNPEIVVLAFCLNDFLPQMIVVASDKWEKGAFVRNKVHPLATVSPYMFKHSALYRFIKIKTIAQDKFDVYSADYVKKNRKLAVDGLQKLRDDCAKSGRTLLVIVYPHLSNPEKDWEREAHRQVLQILPELNIPFVDVHDEYYAYGVEKLRQSADDTVHPNYAGHLIAISKLLEKHGSKIYLPANTATPKKAASIP